MRAVRYDLVIEKGAKLSRVFRYLDSEREAIDLTGYEARFTIRAPDVDGDIVEGLDSTTSGGSSSMIEIDGEAGEIAVDVSALLTVESPASGCKGWYTLKIWPASTPGDAIRLAEGAVRWSPESTRDDVSGA